MYDWNYHQFRIEHNTFMMCYILIIAMVTAKKVLVEYTQNEMRRESKLVTKKLSRKHKRRQWERKWRGEVMADE